MNKIILGAAIALATASQTSHAATWGVKELLASTTEVTEHFKAEMGETVYNSITGVAVELNAQKIAAKAKITYRENNKTEVASFFCHEHEAGVIDCH